MSPRACIKNIGRVTLVIRDLLLGQLQWGHEYARLKRCITAVILSIQEPLRQNFVDGRSKLQSSAVTGHLGRPRELVMLLVHTRSLQVGVTTKRGQETPRNHIKPMRDWFWSFVDNSDLQQTVGTRPCSWRSENDLVVDWWRHDRRPPFGIKGLTSQYELVKETRIPNALEDNIYIMTVRSTQVL